MEDHAGMYFTMWIGVYDRPSRTLRFASAGHHPGFLVPAARDQAAALRTRNGMIGVDPAPLTAPTAPRSSPGASLYLFSDGVFEIVTKDGVEWGLNDFLAVSSGAARRRDGREPEAVSGCSQADRIRQPGQMISRFWF